MRPERRRSLLTTAAREFATAGYEGASLNRIIRSCGMSKSSFYHYVQSKRELFDLVVADLGETMVRALAIPAPDELAGEDFWDRVDELLEQLVTAAQRESSFTDLGRMFYLPGAPAGDDSALGKALSSLESWLEGALAAGRACGAVRDDLPTSLQGQLTIAVLRALDEWTLRHQDEYSPEQARRIARTELQAIRRMLATDHAADAAPRATPL